LIFEELQLTAAGVFAVDHQARAAGVTALARKGLAPAGGADDLERPAAVGAERSAPLNGD